MSAVIGVLVSIGFIILSVITGGDSITALLSAGSAMIVLGGTFGSVITQFGPIALLQAFKAVISLVKPPKSNIALFINQVADWSNLARSRVAVPGVRARFDRRSLSEERAANDHRQHEPG